MLDAVLFPICCWSGLRAWQVTAFPWCVVFLTVLTLLAPMSSTELNLTFKQRILARTLRLLLSWVQQQEVLGLDCFCQDTLNQSVKRALKSFTGHSNKLGRWGKKYTGRFLRKKQFVCLSPLAAPFCLSFYLDLVKTPSGALIWSFLKPMVLGKILYTPDTIETRAIMEKVWLCLHCIRIHPLKRILIYLAWACFFEKK